MSNEFADAFTQMATKYEKGTGGATRRVAQVCVECAPSITNTSIIHDNACGPAIVTECIMRDGKKPTIYDTDIATGMVDIVEKKKQVHGWDHVQCRVMDGQELSFEDNFFTHSFSCFGVFMFPDSKKGVSEMYRTLKPGGWVCVSSWKNVFWIDIAKRIYEQQFRDSGDALGLPNPVGWNEGEDVRRTLLAAGFKNIAVREMLAPFIYDSMEEARNTWEGMLRQMSPLLSNFEKDNYNTFFIPFWQEITKNHLQATKDGKPTMSMFAWVVHGTK